MRQLENFVPAPLYANVRNAIVSPIVTCLLVNQVINLNIFDTRNDLIKR